MAIECPSCKGGEIYEIDQVLSEETGSVNGTIELALFAHYGPYGEMGWMGEKSKRVAVRLSARVCAACGHAVLFTKDLDALKLLVDRRVPGIRRAS